MNDLISRQAAIDAMCCACGYDCDKSKFVYNAPQDEQVIMCPEHYALSTLPSAQPEIIRCKDCKNYYFADNRVPSEQSWVCAAWGIDQTAHMGYCFKAERKEE